MKNKNLKKVYVAISADILHHGHINILKIASTYGEVTVGLLTDSAISSYKSIPLIDYQNRKNIIQSISYVDNVIEQNDYDYSHNLNKLKPDYVVHGDDWKTGTQSKMRQKVIQILKKWGGKLIEPKYTGDISSTKLIDNISKLGTTPTLRINRLNRLLNTKDLIRVMQVHDGLSAMIVEQTFLNKNNKKIEFDAMWDSSLTSSTSRGKPDIEVVDISSRISGLNDIIEVTTKPIIFDCDTGGLSEHFAYTVRSLERLGVGAIIIEDKEGLKKNSLLGANAKQTQADPKNFAKKILTGKKSQVTDELMIIARVESLILNKTVQDAIDRTQIYLDSGADGIMIHSKQKNPNEILKFCEKYHKKGFDKPIVVVPTTYDTIKEKDLINAGVNIVIYANHMLRAAYKPMKQVSLDILKYQRAHEASKKHCISISEILSLIPGTR